MEQEKKNKEKKKLKLKLKLPKLAKRKKEKIETNYHKSVIDKKELKKRKNMERLRNDESGNFKKEKSDNSNKHISKTFLLSLLVFGIVVAIVSYLLFGLLIGACFVFIYFVLILFTQILDLTSRTSKLRKFVKTLFILGIVFGIIGVLCFVGFFTYIVLESPEFDISKLEKGETTILYDKDKNLIATLGSEKREKLTYDELPEVLIDAIIATEDSRFFQHNGFDAPRFMKAAIGQVLGQDAGGASTLTMQIAKNNFNGTEVSITRKFTDIYLSIFKIERAYTKKEILEFYVNIPYLGNNSYGVEQASQSYFNKSASKLNLSEAALIAGLFQAPSDYDPTVNPESAYERRETVLNLMVRHGYITKEEASIANAIPIKDLLKAHVQGVNPYQGYIDTAIAEIVKNTGLDPYVYPMIIYTNMNKKMQDGINNVFNGKSYKWPNSSIQAGAAAVESATGKILAIGAGRNRSGERTFNYATDISRQIGSTAKPLFDYGPGIEFNNWSTGKTFNDKRTVYGGSYMSNHDGAYLGKITLRYALRDSRNVPALLAFRQVNNAKILQFVTSLGIKPEIDVNGVLHEAHSVGAFNGSNPLTMAGAYAAFSNGGYYNETYAVSKIILRDSNEELDFKSTKTKVMSNSTAYMITDVLTGVASDTGIRSAAGVPVATKTGTTNYDYETRAKYNYPSSAAPDGWIAGFSTTTAMVMWTGYVENTKGVYITQGNMVYHRNNLYKALARAVYPVSGSKSFVKPSSVKSVTIEKGSDPEMLPSASTPSNQKVTELFKRGTEPTEVSQKYVPMENVTSLAMEFKDGNVNLSWVAAPKATKNLNEEKPGDFGYFVYLNNKLLGFTATTSYTYTSDNPYGTYKVITGYKNMSTNRSSGATVDLDPNVTFQYNDVSETTLKIGSTWSANSNPITVFKDGIDCTTSASITTAIINETTNEKVTTIDTATEATFKITYTASYLGESETYTKKVIIIKGT